MSASIIESLVISGSRKSDGSANASGKVWAYLPDTSTTAQLYSDVGGSLILTQPLVLDAGGRVPSGTAPDGVFTSIPIRLYIEDADGGVVSDSTFMPATASTVSVDNDAMTGATMDDVLTAALTSFGGQDFKYKESGGATERTVKEKFSEIWVSVKDFGALGDNNNIDTTAIQQAINRVKSLGGGVVYFPPGTYKTDGSVTVDTATGVRLVGAGSRASIIATTHATAASLVLTSCTACTVENVRFEPVNANSSNGITVTSSADTGLHRVTIKSNHAAGVLVGGTSNVYITESSLVGTSYDLYISGTSTTSTVYSTTFGGTATNVFLTGTAKDTYITNSRFRGTNGIEFDSGLTGTNFVFTGNPSLGACTNPLVIGTATLPVYRQWGNGIDSSATSGATGAAQTPVLYKGSEVVLTAASGGAGIVTVNAPAILPGTGTSDTNLYWDFVFNNAAGGAVTWTLNAVFVLDGGTAIPDTAAHTIMVRFRWDRTTSKLRECSRSDTAT